MHYEIWALIQGKRQLVARTRYSGDAESVYNGYTKSYILHHEALYKFRGVTEAELAAIGVSNP